MMRLTVLTHKIQNTPWRYYSKCPEQSYRSTPYHLAVRRSYDLPDTYFSLKDGQFVIFFPEDVHASMVGEGLIKKLLVTVRI
jgi:biofilm protein TabA